jgi:energy-coupling factor transporter ATP-binding protein EcfA2
VGSVIRESVPQGQDIEHVVKELKLSSEPWNAIKLVVLGHGRIGKTTLLSSLEDILKPNSNNNHKQHEISSTVGIDCKSLDIAGGEVVVWDFAGQMEYAATHQFFLSVEVNIFNSPFSSPLLSSPLLSRPSPPSLLFFCALYFYAFFSHIFYRW